MTKPLFEDFEGVSVKQWKQKIQFDLKGQDYNQTLLTNTPEHITIKPFYHAEDLEKTEGTLTTNTPDHWNICERIYVSQVEKALLKANYVIDRGAESIHFVLHNKKIDMAALLEGLKESKIPVYLELHFLDVDFTTSLLQAASEAKREIYLLLDPIGDLNATGNWHYNTKKDTQLTAEILKLLNSDHPGTPYIKNHLSINLGRYLNSGASAVQQLAYAMAHANEYLHLMETNNMKTGTFRPLFYAAIGHHYFFEIAKFRALRILWSTLAAAYDNTQEAHILATPGKRNKTLYDYNVNMLRTTTEYMSAVLGGANTICATPYDALYHKDNEFGSRIARNQLLILKEESYFDAVSNPADGSYYIESVTGEMAEKALDIFKQIEAGGGYLQQLMDHTIQKKIRETAREEQEAFNKKERVLVGTNKFVNPEDRMKDNLELDPFLKREEKKTLIEPIIEKRLSEILEQNRLKEE
ncbi:methylmalonyl-CoA mutase subunit beta [Robertkochia sediminum]|uniref:methylmalonyl-CoA mutase subunit beta n=1 Tax=Robertkochia sediminum TaxID=2785326 RepID=UPI0019332C38|nr:methylmalonyl-CoA mutase subunit beta [Robertkochia sediminum]MBL7472174.1 methylmalonyl-CoA mutase subunit beta [Robertkochia sediminum]